MNGQVRRTLVTGATGFVGSNLTKSLLDDGWQVNVLVRDATSPEALKNIDERAHIHRHNGSQQGLIEILRGTKPDVVFHLASLFISEHTSEDAQSLVQSNVLFGTQLAEAMSVTGCLYLINTGTSWQHYRDSTYNPVNLYAATKQAFESILEYYLQARGFRVITLKLFDTYGPGDRRKKLLSLLKATAKSGQKLTMSPGEQKIDIVHIDDVCAAFMISAQRLCSLPKSTHEQYGVSSGKTVQLRALVELINQITGVKVFCEWGGRSYREREVMTPCKLPALPGWRPNHILERGLQEFFS